MLKKTKGWKSSVMILGTGAWEVGRISASCFMFYLGCVAVESGQRNEYTWHVLLVQDPTYLRLLLHSLQAKFFGGGSINVGSLGLGLRLGTSLLAVRSALFRQ